MEGNERAFAQIVDEAIRKLKEIPGGLRSLKKGMSRSTPMLYAWRRGEKEPSELDKVRFLEVVNEILKKSLQEQEELKVKRVQMVVEFNKLCV